MPSSTVDRDAERLTDALAQSSFEVVAVLSRIAADNDMSLTQLRLLGVLRDRRLRMAELADYLGLERSTTSGLVDRAERRGLLERGRNADDARAVDVRMTRAGLELARSVEREVRDSLAPITNRLDGRGRVALARLLERMLQPS